MNRLGIKIQNDARPHEKLEPGLPLIASSYCRFGFIRLAGAGKGKGAKGASK